MASGRRCHGGAHTWCSSRVPGTPSWPRPATRRPLNSIHRPDPGEAKMAGMRTETDSVGMVQVPADKLWGAQTQRSLEHFTRHGQRSYAEGCGVEARLCRGG